MTSNKKAKQRLRHIIDSSKATEKLKPFTVRAEEGLLKRFAEAAIREDMSTNQLAIVAMKLLLETID